jgi:hypothetical protein
MREHAQPGRSRSSARRCGSLLPVRTRGRRSPAQEFRRRDRRSVFLHRCCRSAAVPLRILRTRLDGGGHAHSSRCRPVRRAIPPGRGGRARTGSRGGEDGSGNRGRSGCRRRSAGRAGFPRRPSRPPTRLGSSRSTGQGSMLSPAWRSCASARSARMAAAEPGSTRCRPARRRWSRRRCAADRRLSTCEPGGSCRTGSGRCHQASEWPPGACGRIRCIPSRPARPCHSRPSRSRPRDAGRRSAWPGRNEYMFPCYRGPRMFRRSGRTRSCAAGRS